MNVSARILHNLPRGADKKSSIVRELIAKRMRWARIKAIQPSRGRYLHVSARCGIRVNALGVPEPWVQKPGLTYDIGRNKAKRQAREAAKFRLVSHG